MKPMKRRFHTLTLDNGLEFAQHEKIAKQLKAAIYFAHPYASWERSINENTNGLIRQYFPKGTDFNQVSDEDIEHVMERLKNRPRKAEVAEHRMNYLWGSVLTCSLHNLHCT